MAKVLLPLLLTLLPACTCQGTPHPGSKEIDVEMEWVYDITPEVLKYKETATGLRLFDVKPGTGPLFKDGDRVSLIYKLYIMPKHEFRGKIKHFFSQSNPSAPYVLELGPGKESKVIPGLEEGVASMRQGGKRVLLIPPQLGYGAHGVPDFLVPPGATLLYYLEHLGRASVDGDATPTPTPTPLYPTPIPTPDPPKPWEVGGEGQVVYPHGTPSSAPNSEL